MEHTHKWTPEPCDFTGTFVDSCACGAERITTMDQDGTTVEIIEPDEED